MPARPRTISALPAAPNRLDFDPPATLLLTVAALAVLGVVLLQAVVGIAPNLYWETDPRLDDSVLALTTFGPTGAVWLAAAQTVIAGLALIAHGRARGAIDWRWVILAGIGAGFAVWHLPGPMADVFRCGQWVGAAAIGVAAGHLATHPWPRRMMVAALLSMLLPLGVDALHYVLVEHPRSLAVFQTQEDLILRGRGWEAGSAEYLAFLRRMESNAALGAFALSNVFGTILAALTALAMAAMLGAVRQRRWAGAAAFGALALLGVAAVVLTRSKGAISVTLLIGAWLTVVYARPGLLNRGHRMGMVAIGLVLAATAAILARGMAGAPESRAGEISLLYRFHYLEAAWNMLAAGDWRQWLAGLGPGGFVDAYLLHKAELNTEAVVSAHHVFVDWIVMLGVGGVVWSALILLWLWQAGRSDATERPSTDPPAEKPGAGLDIDPRAMGCALILAVVVFGGQFLVERPLLIEVRSMLTWLGGAAGFVVVMSVLLSSDALDHAVSRLGLSVAATAIVVQSQIDMAFFHQGSVAVCWLIVALAGGTGARFRALDLESARAIRKRGHAAIVVGALLLAAAGAMGYLVAAPVARHQRHLQQAALAVREGDLGATTTQLESASQELPGDLLAYRWQVTVWMEYAGALIEAGRMGDARAAIHRAIIALDQAFARGVDTAAYWRLRAHVQEQAAQWLSEPGRLRSAVAAWRNVLARNPRSLPDHLALADLLWALDDHGAARELYRRCLELSAAQYLDPVRQLRDEDRARIEARLRDE